MVQVIIDLLIWDKLLQGKVFICLALSFKEQDRFMQLGKNIVKDRHLIGV